MDERSAKHFRITFKMVFKGQCVVTEISDADAVIVYSEKQNAKTVVAEFEELYPEKPFIILSDELVEIKTYQCVTRPAKLSQLLEALKQTISHLPSDSSPKPSIDNTHKLADTSAQKIKPLAKKNNFANKSKATYGDIHYQPKFFLQGKIIDAVKRVNQQNKSVFLHCWSHRWILICPSTDFLVENIKERQLRSLGLVIDNDILFNEANFTHEKIALMAETPINEVKVTSIQKFIWNIAVRTARGRIPLGTSCDSLYVLKRWPNLTRLLKIPNAMRISALWLDQPRSITSIAEKLAIPIKDVFTYFSAASATGLIVMAQRREDKLTVPDVTLVKENKKGLFSALINKLSIIAGSKHHQVGGGK